MTLPTQKLRDEHAGLLPDIEKLRRLADELETAPPDDLRVGLEDAYLFLENHLIPHARAEDRILYPEVARLLGSPRATDTMTRDHVEVGTLANELGVLRVELVEEDEPTHEVRNEARRVLYGLYALLKVHFAKEEELYLPVLDRNLTEDEFNRLYESMGAVGRDTRFQVA
jgi:iron-sulfur cluster repair protein YtfE (RIC family)